MRLDANGLPDKPADLCRSSQYLLPKAHMIIGDGEMGLETLGAPDLFRPAIPTMGFTS